MRAGRRAGRAVKVWLQRLLGRRPRAYRAHGSDEASGHGERRSDGGGGDGQRQASLRRRRGGSSGSGNGRDGGEGRSSSSNGRSSGGGSAGGRDNAAAAAAAAAGDGASQGDEAEGGKRPRALRKPALLPLPSLPRSRTSADDDIPTAPVAPQQGDLIQLSPPTSPRSPKLATIPSMHPVLHAGPHVGRPPTRSSTPGSAGGRTERGSTKTLGSWWKGSSGKGRTPTPPSEGLVARARRASEGIPLGGSEGGVEEPALPPCRPWSGSVGGFTRCRVTPSPGGPSPAPGAIASHRGSEGGGLWAAG